MKILIDIEAIFDINEALISTYFKGVRVLPLEGFKTRETHQLPGMSLDNYNYLRSYITDELLLECKPTLLNIILPSVLERIRQANDASFIEEVIISLAPFKLPNTNDRDMIAAGVKAVIGKTHVTVTDKISDKLDSVSVAIISDLNKLDEIEDIISGKFKDMTVFTPYRTRSIVGFDDVSNDLVNIYKLMFKLEFLKPELFSIP